MSDAVSAYEARSLTYPQPDTTATGTTHIRELHKRSATPSCTMGCDRDRALLECYVSSGARASELLGVTLDDIDGAGQLLYVVSKGSRLRQPVPASSAAFRYLGSYLAADGLPGLGKRG